jgi:hypothetical protein
MIRKPNNRGHPVKLYQEPFSADLDQPPTHKRPANRWFCFGFGRLARVVRR